jgi:hypothetical protein
MLPPHSYQDPVAKLIHLKEKTRWDDKQWLDYVTQFGLTVADLSELSRLSWDEEVVDEEGTQVFCFIHAIRASVQIDPEAGIKLYIELLQKFPDDDWLHEEIDGISRNVGAIAIVPFVKILADPTQNQYLRVTFTNGLEEIGKTYPETRDTCVEALIAQLQNYRIQDDDFLNSVLVDNLINLKAVEAVNLIEEVFASRDLDQNLTGSWPAAQVSLGLKQESDFSPEELKPKPSEKILAIREMLDNLSKLTDRKGDDWKQGSILPVKPAAKGFGSSKKKSSSKKKKSR